MSDKNTRREHLPAKQNLLNMLPSDAEALLRGFAVEHGGKPFRGSQVLRHLWQSPVESFVAMADLPVAFRTLLDEHFTITRVPIPICQSSRERTAKLLLH